MLDFTSALYLGLQHPSCALASWRALTTGAPAALTEPMEARKIARALAGLQGCEAAVLGTSTLHLAWDLFGLLAEKPVALFVDAGVYPITRWGVQRAAIRGAMVASFPHHDTETLAQILADAPRDRAPVIVTDGFCPSCGTVAPLRDYLALARSRGGLLIADDTQALGILGHSPNEELSYGRGGGGSLRWSGIVAPDALVFSSLAKGFGAPLAVLAGSRARIGEFEEKSLTRMHCSPPSIATLHAAQHALVCNRREGEMRRRKLLENVRRFRRGLINRRQRGVFPMQTIQPPPGLSATRLHRHLLGHGVRTVLYRGEGSRARVSFLITARHTSEEIDFVTAALAHQGEEIRHEQPIHS